MTDRNPEDLILDEWMNDEKEWIMRKPESTQINMNNQKCKENVKKAKNKNKK